MEISILKKHDLFIAGSKTIIVLIIIMVFLSGCGNKKEHRVINVSEISGRVSIVEENMEYAAYRGMHLQEGYTVVTSGDSYVRMVLDGNKYIKLEEGSRAKVDTLANGRTEIHLERGSISNEIVKPLYEGQCYIIHTPNATLAVRGTYFCVDLAVDEEGKLLTDVYTYGGSVVSQRKLPSGEVVEESVPIEAGYKASISMDSGDTNYVMEDLDYLVPITMENIRSKDLVDLYFAAQNGHELFVPTDAILETIESRNIDINEYTSAYVQAASIGVKEEGIGPNDNFPVIVEAEISEELIEHYAPSDGPTIESFDVVKENKIEKEYTFEHELKEDVIPESGMNVEKTIVKPESETNEEKTSEEELVTDEKRNEEESETDKSQGETSKDNVVNTDYGAGNSNTNYSEECNHRKVEERKEATCTQAGEVVQKCSICGIVFGTSMIPALGHTEVSTTTAICTTPGIKTISCSVCNMIISEEEDGVANHNTEGNTCSICNALKIASVENFPDEEFQRFLKSSDYDWNGDGYLSDTERVGTNYIYIGNDYSQINSLTGVQYFNNATELTLQSVTLLETLDISELAQLESLQIRACDNLQEVKIGENGENNAIKVLTLVGLPNLKDVLTDLHKLPYLEKLSITDTSGTVSNLDLSQNIYLKDVSISGIEVGHGMGQGFVNITLGNLNYLTNFYISAVMQSEYNFSGCPNLKSLSIYRQRVNSLNLSGCNVLETVDLYECILAGLDMSQMSSLKTLRLDGAEFTNGSLNLENCIGLQTISTGEWNEKYTSVSHINIQSCTSLTEVSFIQVEGLQEVNATGCNPDMVLRVNEGVNVIR